MLARFAMIAAVLLAVSRSHAGVMPLDPNAEKPLREQISAAVQAAMASQRKPTTRETLEFELKDKIEIVEREIARLAKLDEPGKARAESLERRLKAVRNVAAGKSEPSNEPELHVVAIQQIERAQTENALTPAQRRRQFKAPAVDAIVEVEPIGRPMVLALSSYGPARWKLKIAEGASVQRILVGGYENQEVTDAPPGTPVEIHTMEGVHKSPNHFYGFHTSTEAESNGANKLRALTPLDIVTLQAPRMYRVGEPIVVGPRDPEWVAQCALALARPLALEASACTIAAQRNALRPVRFKAVRPPDPVVRPMPPIPAAAGGAAAGPGGVRILVRPAINAAATMCDFSPLGPIDGTEVALGPRTTHLAIDQKDSTIYTVGEGGDISRIDPTTRVATRMQINAPELPRLSSPNGITFDDKRRRLILSTQSTLYAYDPAAAKWAGLVQLENVNAGSFAYSEADDCMYALLMDYSLRGTSWLLRYTPDGDADQLINLSRPIAASRFGPDGAAQMVAVGDKLAVVTTVSRMDMMRVRAVDESSRLPRPRCYLIDPKTGEVTYGGPVALQSGDPSAPANLNDVWLAMKSDDKAEVEQATATLGAGGDRSVTILRDTLKPAKAPDAAKVAEWIARLDDDDFARRDEATRELRRLGRAAEPALREAIAKHPSAEATSRLEALLGELQPVRSGQRASGREAIAIDLLARIGTPSAIDLLSEVACAPADTPLTLGARRALQEFARED